MEALTILLTLVGLALAAGRWGADSQDDVTSAEWERRRAWRGYRPLR
jgi:hypothetical protein